MKIGTNFDGSTKYSESSLEFIFESTENAEDIDKELQDFLKTLHTLRLVTIEKNSNNSKIKSWKNLKSYCLQIDPMIFIR